MTTMRFLRKQMEMTQRELAERIGVRQPNVSYWETNKEAVPLGRRVALARILGCAPDALQVPWAG